LRFHAAVLPADSRHVVKTSAVAAVDQAATPLALSRQEKPLSLGGPQPSRRGLQRQIAALPSLWTMLAGLGVVLGLFLIVAWALRRSLPKGANLLPREALEVLGRGVIAGRQNVHLLRCGNKLLLVSITPAGIETLTEISDPAEVDRLAGICYQAHPHSATSAFRQVFQQFGDDRSARGFFGPATRDRVDFSNFDAPALRSGTREEIDD
jgi:flagellar biogenesis protein FliO